MNERQIIQLILETVRDHLVYDRDLDMWIVDDDFMLALNKQEYHLLDDLCTGRPASKEAFYEIF